MSAQHSSEPEITVTPGTQRKVLGAAAAGNLVEWYDFAVYGYVTTALAANFFPSGDKTASLLATLATFAVAFVMRPVGAMLFGSLGDRLGRRTILAMVISLMAVSTFVMGLLPTYASIGVFAPILLVVVRCLQGLSAGGEYGGATTLVAEYSPKRRAFFLSFLSVSTVLSFVLAALVVAVVSVLVSPATFEGWAWRIPFWLALPIGAIGLYIRLRVEDTPAFRAVEDAGTVERAPLVNTLRTHWRQILKVASFVSCNALGFYFLATYLPTFLQTEGGLSRTASSVSNAVAMLLIAATVSLFGIFGDRFGRKRLMAVTAVMYFVIAVPSLLFVSAGVVALAVCGQLLFALAQSSSQASTAPVITEAFPTRVRYTASGVSYNLAYMVVGGTGPLIATALVAATGTAIAPAFYVMAIAVLAFVGSMLLKETVSTPLLRAGDAGVPSQPTEGPAPSPGVQGT